MQPLALPVSLGAPITCRYDILDIPSRRQKKLAMGFQRRSGLACNRTAAKIVQYVQVGLQHRLSFELNHVFHSLKDNHGTCHQL